MLFNISHPQHKESKNNEYQMRTRKSEGKNQTEAEKKESIEKDSCIESVTDFSSSLCFSLTPTLLLMSHYTYSVRISFLSVHIVYWQFLSTKTAPELHKEVGVIAQ